MEAAPTELRRRTTSLGLVVLGLGLLLLGLATLLALRKPTAAAQTEGQSVIPVRVSFPAPDLQLSDLGGNQASLTDYRGQVVLVNIWATWCPPCKAEMPTLEAYYREHQRAGFTVLAIDAGESVEEVATFVKQMGLSFPVWLDPRMAALAAFKYAGLPSSYVIDRTGTVRLAWTGAISREMLERHVTPLVEN